MTSDFSVPSDWYLTFFTDPVMHFWDAVVPPAATDAEIAFILRHLPLHPPARILDVPCGSGRHALALARKGFTVTGVDLAEAALSRARRSAETTGLAVRFVHSNMLEFEASEPSDALICMGNSIGYCEPALTCRLLRRFATALRRGGRLILDTSVCAESLLPIEPNDSFAFPGGSYERQLAYDPMRSVLSTRAYLSIDAERHELRYQHFVMTSGELVRSLRSAGFTVSALHGDTEDAPFGPGSPRLLLIAVRE